MSISSTYIFYYIIVLSSGLIVYFSEYIRKANLYRISKFVFYCAIIIPVIVGGVRYGIGTDYFSYERIYYNLTQNYSGFYYAFQDNRFEPGWVLLNIIVKIVFDDVKYVFFLSALLTWLFSFKAIYDNRNRIVVSIAVIILLCILYNISFNTVRQTLSISIIMLSVKPLLNKRILKFIVLILFASSFHYTSLIFLPVYWIVNSKSESVGLLKKILIPLLFIGLVLFIDSILSLLTNIDIFSSYDNYELEYRGIGIRDLVLKLPIVILILFNFKKLKQQNNPINHIVILYFIGIILSLLGGFAPHIDRVARFFDIMQVFIIAAIVKEQKNKYEKILYVLIIISFYLLWFSFYYLYLGRQETIPYQWKW